MAFAVDLVFKAAVADAKLFDTVFQRHGSSTSWVATTFKLSVIPWVPSDKSWNFVSQADLPSR
jgi:hypothetical protein